MQEALDSVMAQSYTHWECVIVNDGSTDNTAAIAKINCEKDARFKYIEKQNGGLSSARNAGLKVASGNWIQFLDADDYITPQKLELSIAELVKNESLTVVVSNFRMFVNSHAHTTAPFCELKLTHLTFENILFNWDIVFAIPIHCGLFNSAFFKNYAFDKTLKANEDWVMWINLFMEKPNAVYLKESLAFYRINPKSMTKDKSFVLTSLMEAYKNIISFLPEKYAKEFAAAVVDRLHSTIVYDKVELLTLKSGIAFKLDRKFKNAIHKISLKLKRR